MQRIDAIFPALVRNAPSPSFPGSLKLPVMSLLNAIFFKCSD
jgi:hypothetical protein